MLNEDEDIINAWIMRFMLSTENSNIIPIILYVSEVYICEGITNIGDGCCGLGISINKVLIGDTVISIENSGFASCSSLTNITIPSSVTSIGVNAFSGCDSLTSVTYEGKKEEWDNIEKTKGWKDNTLTKIICTDGEITL